MVTIIRQVKQWSFDMPCLILTDKQIEQLEKDENFITTPLEGYLKKSFDKIENERLQKRGQAEGYRYTEKQLKKITGEN